MKSKKPENENENVITAKLRAPRGVLPPRNGGGRMNETNSKLLYAQRSSAANSDPRKGVLRVRTKKNYESCFGPIKSRVRTMFPHHFSAPFFEKR